MGRDVEKAGSGDTNKKNPVGKANGASSKAKHGSKESKRGWRDVFDNIDYTAGPGDNIYVFG